MPLPKPKKGEKEQPYISRCIRFAIRDARAKGKKLPQKQAAAMCYDTWRKAKGQKKQEENAAKETYRCECLDCGHIEEFEKHCRDVKCPKCGGEMRRVERPGPGQRNQEELMDFEAITLEVWEGMGDGEKLSVYYALWGHEQDYVELAKWTRAFINDLPNAAFAAIEPAYSRGKTDNKNARHLPHHGKNVKSATENSSVDITHYRNARARQNQIQAVTDSITTAALRRRASSHLNKHTAVLKTKPEKKEQSDGLDDTMELTAVMVGQIHLSDDGKMFRIPLIRRGTWEHPYYGELVYDEEKLNSFVDNFHNDTVGHDLAFTKGHRGLFNPTPETLAWWKDVVLEDGYQLVVYADPTEEGLALIPSKLRYASAEVKENFVDTETGEEYGPTLVGGAATNVPFITRQGAITLLSEEVLETYEEQDGVNVVLVQAPAQQATTLIVRSESMNEQEKAEEQVTQEQQTPEPARHLELRTESGETVMVTAEEVQALFRQNEELRQERHRTAVEKIIQTAQDRGVPPAVLRVAEPILMEASEEAPGKITLEGSQDEINLFQAVKRLVEVVPSTLGEMTYSLGSERPFPASTDEMSLDEAEQWAKDRRKKLASHRGAPTEAPQI